MRIFGINELMKGTTPLGELPDEKQAFFTMLHIAWPSILESFLIHLVGMIDTLMVSKLGAYAITSVGLTTQPKFIALALFISLNVAVSALVARRKGEQNPDGANKVLGQAIVITIILSTFISVLCVMFANPIIKFAGAESDTLPYAASYYKIIMGCMIFNVIGMVINAAQRGAGNTKIAMITNITSNVVNVIFNYLLIEGRFGFPALGVKGAAIATVIGTVVACIMSICSILKHDRFITFSKSIKIKFDKRTTKAICDIGSSTLAEQIFMRIGFFMYSLIVAKLGTIPFAAHQVGMNILSISFSLGDGLSVACVALVGQNLGSVRPDLAKIYGSMCQRFGILLAGCLSLFYIIFGRQIFALFSDDPAILNYGSKIMLLISVVVFLQIFQVICSGCLRGAGDTRYTAFVSLISVAVIRPFMGWLFCYPIAWGLIGAWIAILIDQFIRFIMTYMRFKSGKWMRFKI